MSRYNETKLSEFINALQCRDFDAAVCVYRDLDQNVKEALALPIEVPGQQTYTLTVLDVLDEVRRNINDLNTILPGGCPISDFLAEMLVRHTNETLESLREGWDEEDDWDEEEEDDDLEDDFDDEDADDWDDDDDDWDDDEDDEFL